MERRALTNSPLTGSTILVTGGTGFTGTNLLRKLVGREGIKVRCIARASSEIPPDLADAVTWYRGDVYDAEVVEEAVEGVNYIFHLAACFRDPGVAAEEYQKVHVESTKRLAEAARAQPEFKRFVHTSTIGVHGHIEDPPADETAPYNPGDLYQKTKLEGELWIRDFAEENDLPLSVIRPAAIMGPSDRRLLKLFKFAQYGFFPLLDGHNTRYHLIHVEDLTDCMLLASHHPDALGDVFICGNAEPTSVVEMLTQIGDLLKKNVRFISLPSTPLFILADVVEWVSKKVGVEPILYRRRMAFFTKDRCFDTSKLRDVLGFEHRYDNEAGIRDVFQGYEKRGWL
ncbi:nucleoside-diphosphate-sugar epimerase [Salinibacter ruber]|uniref:NAD-dependent epimerase/dehydratase family protein n=1 Tax=Salinibacter ruber TaxID=146919 RepID=UPI00216792C0|nr:NAD(P)-dependent oxidoreductase [Salinibacter ruber]MCS3700166.1 nucleoside-diphosphate-sugar epimerase [Salinibacter ruber]